MNRAVPGGLEASSPFDLAIVGAGWAGLAAAVVACAAGKRIVLVDAAPQAGGRARRQSLDLGFGPIDLDNGQHLLIGAYRQTLELAQRIGLSAEQLFNRQRLLLRDTQGLHLAAPHLPAPAHLVWALLAARGFPWSDRRAVVRMISGLRRDAWQVTAGETVSTLLDRMSQPSTVRTRLWERLCISALNTPSRQACAQTFASVLRDSLGSARANSDFLIPRATLSDCLPDPALRWLSRQGAVIRLRTPIRTLVPDPGRASSWQLHHPGGSIAARGVILACNVSNSLRLLERIGSSDTPPIVDDVSLAGRGTPGRPQVGRSELRRTLRALSSFSFHSIATLWVSWPASHQPAIGPPLMLHREAGGDRQADWLFDRGVWSGHRVGAWVISLADELKPALDPERAIDHARELCRTYGFVAPVAARLIIEKRATFACVPGRAGVAHEAAGRQAGLWLAGDYTEAHYPATLESAVRSGMRAGQIAADGLDAYSQAIAIA
ncbi:MAG: Hydroxysqualene dehydroxylase [Pseudomonadota bacterium]